VATKIKLMRLGKMRAPYYRIVVADARTKRDGRSIETIGKYHPKEDPSFIEIDSERAQYWLGVGAQPTEAVAAILRVTGDWQQFKGEPAPPPMLVKAPKPDKRALFEAASQHSADEPTGDATTPRKRAARPATPTADSGAGSAAPSRAAADKAAAGTPTAGPTADQAAADAAAQGTTLLEQRVEAGDPAAVATTPAAHASGEAPTEATVDVAQHAAQGDPIDGVTTEAGPATTDGPAASAATAADPDEPAPAPADS
jgi:small subunit ribosomal protein S16